MRLREYRANAKDAIHGAWRAGVFGGTFRSGSVERPHMKLGSRLLAALVAIVALAGLSRGEEPQGTPVPASQLRGRTLVLEAQNCTIDAPGASWDWVAMPSSEPNLVFQCRPPGQGEVYVFQVWTVGSDKLDEKVLAEFNDTAAKEREKTGDKVSAKVAAPSSLPLGGSSYRFSVKLVHPNGAIEYLHGYLAGAGKLYVFAALTRDDKDSELFKGFVTSFRLLRPVSSFGAGKGIALGLLCMIAGLVAASLLSRKSADETQEIRKPETTTKKPERT
jgi:hypothetical protein